MSRLQSFVLQCVLFVPLVVFSGKCLAVDAWIFIPTQSAAQAEDLMNGIFGGQDIRLTPRESDRLAQEFLNFMVMPLTHRHFLLAYGSPVEAMATLRMESFRYGLLLQIRVDQNFRRAPLVLHAFRNGLNRQNDPGGNIGEMLTYGPVTGNLYASPFSNGGFIAGFDGTVVPHTIVINARVENRGVLGPLVANPTWDERTPFGPNDTPVDFSDSFSPVDAIQVIRQAARAVFTVAAVCVAYWVLTNYGSGPGARSVDGSEGTGTCNNVQSMPLKEFVDLESRYRARFMPAVNSIIQTF
ncbi:hypothetical protein [Bordetella flabilis]|uniref:Uncharacterized protein n=1 Tax=Bordetella flabilis TaxID=463014 RepID=A0A193GCG6_9BORD|nr:hypothetical protein [Bordetella flabilis]ANN77520.1 hypothetical protein BAU07_10750 [Bordetella flabilis]